MDITCPNCLLRPLVAADAPALARHANDRLVWQNLRDRFPHPYSESTRASTSRMRRRDPFRRASGSSAPCWTNSSLRRMMTNLRSLRSAPDDAILPPMSRPSLPLALILVALAVGLVEPSLEVAWKCRAGFESSEACVWGRSYLPLGRVVGLVVVAPLTFGVMMFVRGAWRAWSGRSRR